jgi:hypothetical protein
LCKPEFIQGIICFWVKAYFVALADTDYKNALIKGFIFCKMFFDNNCYFRCDATGLTKPTSFANCVDGRKVANYGTPYDFNSVLHYGVYS